MGDSPSPALGRQSISYRPGGVSRSRATSSSSVLTSASMNASPIKVAIASSSSQPQVSQDHASAYIKRNIGEAIPELQRTLPDLDIGSGESTGSLSSSSRERTPRPHHMEAEDHMLPEGGANYNRLASPSRRRSPGSRRSTISASTATTSVNLDTADFITVTPTMDAVSGLLSKSTESSATGSVDRKGKGRDVGKGLTAHGAGKRSSRRKEVGEHNVEANSIGKEAFQLTQNGTGPRDDPWPPLETNCGRGQSMICWNH